MATVQASIDTVSLSAGTGEERVNIDFLNAADCKGKVVVITNPSAALKFSSVVGTSQYGRDVSSGTVYLTLESDNFYVYKAAGSETFDTDI